MNYISMYYYRSRWVQYILKLQKYPQKRVEMEHETNLGIHNEVLCDAFFKCRSCITEALNKSGLETISINLASDLNQSCSLDCKRSKLMNALESIVEEIH